MKRFILCVAFCAVLSLPAISEARGPGDRFPLIRGAGRAIANAAVNGRERRVERRHAIAAWLRGE